MGKPLWELNNLSPLNKPIGVSSCGSCMWWHIIKPNCGIWTNFLILLEVEGIQSALAHQVHLHSREDFSKAWSRLPWNPNAWLRRCHYFTFPHTNFFFIFHQVASASRSSSFLLCCICSDLAHFAQVNTSTLERTGLLQWQTLWKSGLGAKSHHVPSVISQLFGILLSLWMSHSQNGCVFIVRVHKLAVPLPSTYSFHDFGNARWSHMELTRTLEKTED